MQGKVIDMDRTDAFITFEDNTTMDISLSRLPEHIKIGDKVDIQLSHNNIMNDHMDDFF